MHTFSEERVDIVILKHCRGTVCIAAPIDVKFRPVVDCNTHIVVYVVKNHLDEFDKFSQLRPLYSYNENVFL